MALPGLLRLTELAGAQSVTSRSEKKKQRPPESRNKKGRHHIPAGWVEGGVRNKQRHWQQLGTA